MGGKNRQQLNLHYSKKKKKKTFGIEFDSLNKNAYQLNQNSEIIRLRKPKKNPKYE